MATAVVRLFPFIFFRFLYFTREIVQEIEFTPLEEFEFWLDDMEIKLSSTLGRPKSREDAKYIVNVAKAST